jgi:hypothetical protein
MRTDEDFSFFIDAEVATAPMRNIVDIESILNAPFFCPLLIFGQ